MIYECLLNIKNCSLLWVLFLFSPFCNIVQGVELTNGDLIRNLTSGLYAESLKDDPALQLAPHPRLFFSKGQEVEIFKQAEKNALLADLIATLKIEADKKLSLTLQKFTSEGKLLQVAREQVSRVLTLSMDFSIE